MRPFAVTVHARNLLVDFEHRIRKLGFYTVRFVEAASVEDAARSALESIASDGELLQRLRNPPNDPPVFEIDSVDEGAPAATDRQEAPGRAWYEESCLQKFWHRLSRTVRRRTHSATSADSEPETDTS